MATHHHHEQRVPRGALLGAAVLLGLSLALAAQAHSARHSDPSGSVTPAVQVAIDLRFEDRADGSVAVLDAATTREIDVVPSAEGGFVRGVMRGMFRTRKLESIPPSGHFRLVRYVDGALVLEDPHSGRRVDLRSFGATNYDAFARLLTASEEIR
ncbi:MAG: photosynthetic complex assembly protein PuhC [Myxococcota bacterium]